MIDGLLVSFNLCTDVNKLLFVHLNELKVFLCDVIVVLLHLLERFLMIAHQIIDVLVLTLFDFVYLDLHAKL